MYIHTHAGGTTPDVRPLTFPVLKALGKERTIDLKFNCINDCESYLSHRIPLEIIIYHYLYLLPLSVWTINSEILSDNIEIKMSNKTLFTGVQKKYLSVISIM